MWRSEVVDVEAVGSRDLPGDEGGRRRAENEVGWKAGRGRAMGEVLVPGRWGRKGLEGERRWLEEGTGGG